MYAYSDLFDDAEAEEDVAGLRKQRISQSSVENISFSQEAESEIFLRNKCPARHEIENQMVLRNLLTDEERDERVHQRD